ncbi:MAG: oligosaccharide flippase family protein [Saprospiraceae bacterium]|nr:oligosaccharide flippase family protein [Saprospiraceae bacterium]
MSILRKFFKDTLIYGLASITPRLVSFILVPIHTSSLDTALYSINTNYYVYAVFLNALLTMGMETAFFRFFSAETDKMKVVSSSFVMLLLSSVVFLITAWPAAGFLATYFGFPDPYFIKLLILTLFFDTLVVIPFAYLRATGKSLMFAGFRILNVLILLILNVWLLLILPSHPGQELLFSGFIDHMPDVSDIFLANVVASIFTFLLCLPIIFKVKLSWDAVLAKKMFLYGWPVMVAGFAYAVNENLDKLFISQYLGDDVNGMYAGCYKLGVFMSLYVMTFRLGAEPFFFNQYGKEGAELLYSKILTWFVIFGCLCMLLVTGFVDLFAGLLLKRASYKQALDIVPVILLANMFLGVYNNLSVWYKLKDKTRMGMLISVFGALITIVLLPVLLPVLGYMGAAYTTLIVYFFMAATSYILGRKYYPVPYETTKVLTYLGLTAGISMLSFYFFRGNSLVNLGILIVFMMLVMFREGLFKKVVKNKV